MPASGEGDRRSGRILAGSVCVLLIAGSAASMIGYLGMRLYSARNQVTQDHLMLMAAAAAVLGVLSAMPIVPLVKHRSAMSGGFRHWRRLVPIAAGAAVLWLLLGTASLILGI